MTKEEKISRIIQLESEITSRIIRDFSFRASIDDEYKSHREEINLLREELGLTKKKK